MWQVARLLAGRQIVDHEFAGHPEDKSVDANKIVAKMHIEPGIAGKAAAKPLDPGVDDVGPINAWSDSMCGDDSKARADTYKQLYVTKQELDAAEAAAKAAPNDEAKQDALKAAKAAYLVPLKKYQELPEETAAYAAQWQIGRLLAARAASKASSAGH
jgi:hypothetical protein